MNHLNSQFQEASKIPNGILPDVWFAKQTLKREMCALSDHHQIAEIIARSFHEPIIRRTGKSYYEHIDRVHRADEIHADIVYTEKHKIVALLHDLIEDSDGLWTLDDFRDLKFDNEIIEALEAITKGKDEPYFNFIERVGRNAIARVVKIADNRDNHTDFPSASKRKAYDISSKYLWAIEYGQLPAGSCIKVFAQQMGKYDPVLFDKYYKDHPPELHPAHKL